MGISASQARLLTITARLTSNEYETQQISNAKMRLATQSSAASKEYIAALNATQLNFTTYNDKGEATSVPLTANVLYQYSDLKNQYAIVNSSGQLLLNCEDATNFEISENLEDFLSCYGVEKVYKSTALAECANKLTSSVAEGGVLDYLQNWQSAIQQLMTTGSYVNEIGDTITVDSQTYQQEKAENFELYNTAMEYYDSILVKYAADLVDDLQLNDALDSLSEAKVKFANYTTYEQYIKSKLAYIVDPATGDKNLSNLYLDSEKYYSVLADFNAEAENMGCENVEDTYKYIDNSKAQWYTNLWYRLNGESTNKSVQGEKATNYTILDSKLADSSYWIQDALKQGMISLEMASYDAKGHEVVGLDNPLDIVLNGISWSSALYTNCSEFERADDDSAKARAEAEYTRKTNEINAKDTKYQNKIKTLDTEHSALQTEYDAVQSAMNKTIERSFKTFNG